MIPSTTEVNVLLTSGKLQDYMPAGAGRPGSGLTSVMRNAVRGNKGTLTDVAVLDELYNAIPGWSIKPIMVPVRIKYDYDSNNAPIEMQEAVAPFLIAGDLIATANEFSSQWEHDKAALELPMERAKKLSKALEGVIVAQGKPGPDAPLGGVYGKLGKVKIEAGKNFLGWEDWKPTFRAVVDFDLYTAVPGRKVTTPKGTKTAVITKNTKGQLSPIFLSFAAKSGLKDLAKKYLEDHDIPLKAPTKAERMRVLEGTGTCAVCMQNVKLTTGNRVMRHGWEEVGQRRAGDYGHVFHSGSCPGVKYLPWEFSPKGAEDYTDKLRAMVPRIKARIAQLETDPPPFFTEKGHEWKAGKGKVEVVTQHDRGTHDYERLLQYNKTDAKKELRWLEDDIGKLVARIDTWKLQPLPGQGAR